MADQVVTVPILKEVLKETMSAFRVDLVREVCDETRALIAASEYRLEQRLTLKIEQAKFEIIKFIDSSIVPQIDDLQRDNRMIKRHLKLA